MRRRELAWILFAGAGAAQPVRPETTAAEDLTAAQERVKGNRGELAKFSITMATEPAFAFKA
jgi:hypothetical protein